MCIWRGCARATAWALESIISSSVCLLVDGFFRADPFCSCSHLIIIAANFVWHLDRNHSCQCNFPSWLRSCVRFDSNQGERALSLCARVAAQMRAVNYNALLHGIYSMHVEGSSGETPTRSSVSNNRGEHASAFSRICLFDSYTPTTTVHHHLPYSTLPLTRPTHCINSMITHLVFIPFSQALLDNAFKYLTLSTYLP